MNRLAVIIGSGIIAIGCTPATTPDEFSLHGFHTFGNGGDVSLSDGIDDTFHGRGDGGDTWTVGATLTWYIDQPKTPLYDRWGHSLR